jgi:hypothetical protein
VCTPGAPTSATQARNHYCTQGHQVESAKLTQVYQSLYKEGHKLPTREGGVSVIPAGPFAKLTTSQACALLAGEVFTTLTLFFSNQAPNNNNNNYTFPAQRLGVFRDDLMMTR